VLLIDSQLTVLHNLGDRRVSSIGEMISTR